MTTERQKAANSRNAKRSTGPRTTHGKARVKNNARRHGLASTANDPGALAEIEALARALAGEKGQKDGSRMFFARRAAEAQYNLMQVKMVKKNTLKTIAAEQAPNTVEMEEVTKELCKLERYERRSTSRRNTAFRKLRATWEERLLD